MGRALVGLALLAFGAAASAAQPAPCGSERRLAFTAPCADAFLPSPETAPPRPHPTTEDPWFGPDKALHAAGSFLFTLSGQYVLTAKLGASEGEAWPIAAGGTLVLGVGKEALDGRRARNPHFSWRDLAADAVGVALATALIHL